MTDVVPSTATVHVGTVPLQAPDQPPNVEPSAGVAVRVISVPCRNCAWQFAPQSMPSGTPTTVPLPVPLLLTLSGSGSSAKCATTDRAPSIENVQLPMFPVHAPLQPVKVDPGAATARIVTAAPFAKLASQIKPHAMPARLLVSVPLPGPPIDAVSVAGCCENVATTVFATLSEVVQVMLEPVHPPLQPMKPVPGAATSVRVTSVPFVKSYVHVDPQSMPAGLLVTVPEPVPRLLMVSLAGSSVKVATISCGLISTESKVQVRCVPLQMPPLHPVSSSRTPRSQSASSACRSESRGCRRFRNRCRSGCWTTEPAPVPAFEDVHVRDQRERRRDGARLAHRDPADGRLTRTRTAPAPPVRAVPAAHGQRDERAIGVIGLTRARTREARGTALDRAGAASGHLDGERRGLCGAGEREERDKRDDRHQPTAAQRQRRGKDDGREGARNRR